MGFAIGSDRRPREGLAAVTFDVTGTLLDSPRIGEIYAEVLHRHGLPGAPEEIRRLIPLVWRELDCLAVLGQDRFASHPGGARGYWGRFIARLALHLGAPEPPTPFVVAELFHRFGTPEAWEVYPDVLPAFEALRARGLRLAVISNWDDRLPGLLDALGLGPYLTAVVYSSDVGTEKPDPAIFEVALERLGLEWPEAVLHVGDSLRHDVEGAQAAGMRAVHLDRDGSKGGMPNLRGLVAATKRWERH